MGDHTSYFSSSGGGKRKVPDGNTDDYPVEQVSHEEARAFCQRLAELERVPAGSIRLPTEAEWEYAARASSSLPAFGGDLGSYAWFLKNSKDQTHPVKQKEPNAFGLYDMAGNVSELCSDWYADRYPGDAQTDPRGPREPAGPGLRVLRGGSFIDGEQTCRPTDRGPVEPDDRLNAFGFRIVLEAEAAKHLQAADH
jgi:formylglycine-generating enzyme required for sulfatase activity